MTHFFDMDGTLALYEREVYTVDTVWYEALYKSHYFRNLPEIDKSVDYFKSLLKKDPDSVYIITDVAIPSEAIYYEMAADKIMWVNERFKDFDPSHMAILNCLNGKKKLTKAEAAIKMLGRPLNADDFLYDDYNKNLITWKMAGGTPIKILNGLNSKRADMKCIDVA